MSSWLKRGGVAKVVKIPVGREELEAKVKTFVQPFINADPDGFSAKRAHELYGLLPGRRFA